MSHIRSKGMAPEMAVRRLLFSLGYRYRLHVKNLNGTPDIVFKGRKKAIFVHGCFWHQHNEPSCNIVRTPKSKKDYWTPKLKRNVERDKENIVALSNDGWDVMVVWECELKEMEALIKKFAKFLG